MSLFRRDTRAPGDPGDVLVPARMSSRSSSRPVSMDAALGIPAVWACVGLRADVVSTLPLQVLRELPNGLLARQPAPSVLRQPSADFDIVEWLYASQMSLDTRGNAYGVIVGRDKMGRATQIELQHPDTVAMYRHGDGSWSYKVSGRDVPAEDMWHERANTVAGSPVGLSPIAYFARTLGISISAEQFGGDWFADGAHPSALLQSTNAREITETLARQVKSRFMATVNGREPLVLAGSWDYKQLSVSPNESQFIETMKFGGQQVCRIFRTPPELVGLDSGSSMTYANVEQRAIQYLTFGIGPTLKRRETKLSTLLADPDRCRFDADELARTDVLTRWRVHQLQLQTKARTPDEVRHDENWEPLTVEQIAQIKDLSTNHFSGVSAAASLGEIGTDDVGAVLNGGN